jgi:hypothetical protein
MYGPQFGSMFLVAKEKWEMKLVTQPIISRNSEQNNKTSATLLDSKAKNVF